MNNENLLELAILAAEEEGNTWRNITSIRKKFWKICGEKPNIKRRL